AAFVLCHVSLSVLVSGFATAGARRVVPPLRRADTARFLPAFAHPLRASAPPMISRSSLVIAAWRPRLYWRVYLPIISDAFLVALSIAVICEPKNDAIDSSIER